MRPFRAALIVVTAGVLTFGVVFTLLQVTRSEAAPTQLVVAPTPTAEAAVRDASSVAARIAAATVAVGVPITGSELLLGDVQPGDRLDVLASLPSPGDGRPVTAVVVRGATVLQPGSPSDPLLLQVPAQDAMALAHLVLGGTRLGYIVWSANGGSPSEAPPLDEQTARSLLGLAPTAVQVQPTAIQIQPIATLAPAATPGPPAAGIPRFGCFLYQAQPGDTWASIASTFGLSLTELKRWNETLSDAIPAPGSLVLIPRS